MRFGPKSALVAAVLVLSTALLSIVPAGCAEERECACPQGKLLDRELMLLLSTARAYHHQANIHLQQGDVERAVETVRRILKLELSSRWPEAEEVRLDATARLAKLLLGQDKEDAALEVVRQGLEGAKRESFYFSNLHSVRGEILEHRSKRLDGEGAKDQARGVAREAMAAFERSIAINKRLQQQLLKQERDDVQ